MTNNKNHSFVSILLFFVIVADSAHAKNSDIQFETRALDLDNKDNINLSNFSRSDYLPEGNYLLSLKLNNRTLVTEKFRVVEINGDSKVCFTPDLLRKLDIKSSALKKIIANNAFDDDSCIIAPDDEGITMSVDRRKSELLLSIPQAMLNYSDPNWIPPSQWDEGIPGILLDYTLTGSQYGQKNSSRFSSLSTYGTAGINAGAWRLRGNYQSFLYNSNKRYDQSRFRMPVVYLTRSLNNAGAHLTLGKSFLSSDVFDSINYTGISIASDDRMLPAAFRGYAPVFEGIANSNAKVTISRSDDSIIYERMVPPGNFIINDLTDTTSGELKMTIKEENGETRTTTIQTANVPFLTRSGHIRYKAMIGRANENKEGFHPGLATGELSIGTVSGASLFGGVILTDEKYYALNSGVGYDMNTFGALSVDITYTDADLDTAHLKGKSYRVNYSKIFDSIDSQITFAGYRFSERSFLALNDFINMKTSPDNINTSKESYNIVASKTFSNLGFSLNAMFSKQTYWQDVSDSNTFGLSISKSFDIGDIKGINAYLSANRTEYKKNIYAQNQNKNNSLYLSFNIPLSSRRQISTSMQMNNGRFSPSTFYTNNSNPNHSWSVGANSSNSLNQSKFNGNMAYSTDKISTTVNTSIGNNDYYVGGSLKSSITATSHGVVLHQGGYSGNTRLLVDANGIAGVYVGNGYAPSPTNAQGLAVISNVPEYYRTDYSVDPQRLPDNIDNTSSNIQTVLTKNAIGYKKLNIYRGIKAFIHLTDTQGEVIPFGTAVEDVDEKREVGMVGENGDVYISGVNINSTLNSVDKNGHKCHFSLKDKEVSLAFSSPIVCQSK
ncbi:fimbria/pilus outer membrane usher protein [Serratia silvae]|uniref:Fimbrial biogenesis outer membrane usher protein n=1 Tax=Serratia silvae TaxID=2824122 RepID=A0ABT0KAC0_9GAMM|nr:fimbria/pilus outer membrane usher protein [Serratia silvae]MCL1028988.1 fimbrial biogenesis outer membrane usher protein [Serratia silvae]